jgi:ribosomal protein S18 acetylase RimI-like enzyme
MSIDFEICKAEFSDLEEILTLQKKAYLTEAAIYDDFTIPPLHQSLASIAEEFQETSIIKVVSPENRIVGSVRIAVKNKTGHIGKLIVDQDFRGLGIGKRLLSEIEELHKQEVARFVLFTGALSERNLHIYYKAGYKEFKREILNDKVTIVYLEKYINPSN